MVKLECIEDGCPFLSQDLPFDQAEKILSMHLNRKHPIAAPEPVKETSTLSSAPAPGLVRSAPSPSKVFAPSFSSKPNMNSGASKAFYVYMVGFPTNQNTAAEYEQALKNAGCPGEICMGETESGKFSGEVVIKVQTEAEKNNILNMNLSGISEYIAMKEIGAGHYFKIARKTCKDSQGRNLFIRLKGMEWTSTEEDVRNFLEGVSIEELIMTKTPTGRPTGEAFLMLKSEADTEAAKRHNRKYLGRRFVVIEEVFEEQYKLAKGDIDPSPMDVDPSPSITRPSVSTSSFSSKPLSMSSGAAQAFYVYLIGFPTNQGQAAEYEQALKNAGCPGEICMAETESGKFSGEAVIKVDTEAEKNAILNMNLSGISDNISIKEIGAGHYFKIARKTCKDSQGRNLFIRLKGMEWTSSEDDVRKFMEGVSIVELIMTKTPTGRPTGEAFLMLQTEADTELAKRQNRKYLGRRFVIVEEVFEEQYNMAKQNIDLQVASKATPHNPADYVPGKVMLSNLPAGTTEDEIIRFFSVKADCQVEKVEEINETGRRATAVVLMKSDKDVILGLSCQHSTLNRMKVKVDKIRKSGPGPGPSMSTSSPMEVDPSLPKPSAPISLLSSNPASVTGTSLSGGASKAYYMYMIGFPTNQRSAEEYFQALRSAGCPGDICMGETEAGKFSGEVVIKVDTEAEKNTILNLNLSGISDNIAIKEIGAGAYFKIAKKTSKDSQGRNLFIRLKGMEWTATEEDVRKFLADVSIVELIMTKTSTGRPTGEAFLMLKTEADTELAKRYNRQYLGRRFVVIEEVFEEQYNLAKQDIDLQVASKAIPHNPADFVPGKVILANVPAGTTEDDIKRFFVEKGDCQVEKVEEINETGKRVTAVVLMKSKKDVILALTCHNSTLNGMKVRIDKIRKSG